MSTTAESSIQNGFLTIKGFHRVKRLLGVDELIKIVNEFLQFYGHEEVDKELIIEFRPNLHRRWSNIVFTMVCLLFITVIFSLVVSLPFTNIYFSISIFSFQVIAYIVIWRTIESLFYNKGAYWAGIFINRPKSHITIYTNNLEHKKRMNLLNTIVHELDHFVWFLEGRALDPPSIPHASRKQEIRAFQRSEEWIKRLQKAAS